MGSKEKQALDYKHSTFCNGLISTDKKHLISVEVSMKSRFEFMKMYLNVFFEVLDKLNADIFVNNCLGKVDQWSPDSS